VGQFQKVYQAGLLQGCDGKGTSEHRAVIGDIVGDPLKDTSGPALNILIKLIGIISVVFAAPMMRIQERNLEFLNAIKCESKAGLEFLTLSREDFTVLLGPLEDITHGVPYSELESEVDLYRYGVRIASIGLCFGAIFAVVGSINNK